MTNNVSFAVIKPTKKRRLQVIVSISKKHIRIFLVAKKYNLLF